MSLALDKTISNRSVTGKGNKSIKVYYESNRDLVDTKN